MSKLYVNKLTGNVHLLRPGQSESILPDGLTLMTDEQVAKNSTGRYEYSASEGDFVLKSAPEKTTQQKINDLELSITDDHWRKAHLGNLEATAFISDVDAQIESLRELL